MATYYWVGGSGTWDATSTTNWASSSGGSGGAGVPTTADDVIFDANSNIGTGTFTVTVGGTVSAPSVCKDFTTGGAGGALDGAMTLALGSTGFLDCYGSMTWPATNFSITLSGAFTTGIRFRGTATGRIFTTNGVAITGQINLQIVEASEVTLGSALTAVSASISNFGGTFNTGNYNVSVNAISLNGTALKTYNLGSSTITVGGSAFPIDFQAITNSTVNAGTSQINLTNASLNFFGGGFTFYNVSCTSTASGNININGANTFNNLTIATPATVGKAVVLGGNQTVNGTLTFGATNTAVNRVAVRSSLNGTPRTLTVATIATLSDVDFQDIVAAGASSPWSGTRIGDGGGNSNITTATPKTVYWNLAGAQNWSATGWALSSGGAPAINNFPLAQDTAVFDNTGAVTGTITISTGIHWLPETNITKTGAMTLASGANSVRFYGSLTFQAATVLTGTGIWTYAPTGKNSTITSNGITLSTPFTVASFNGGLAIADNFTIGSTLTFNLSNGTLTLNNNTLSCGVFSSSNSNVRSIAFGTGNITATNNNVNCFAMGNANNFTYTGTPTVNLTYSGSTGTRNINFGGSGGGATESNVLSFNISAGSDTFRMGDTTIAIPSVKNVNFTGFSGTFQNDSRVIYGNLTLSSTMTMGAGIYSTFFRATSGTQQITTAGKTLDFPLVFNGIGGTFAFQDALTQGSTQAFTITNGTVQLKNGVTSTVGSLLTSGTNQKFLQSTLAGSQATLNQATGTVSVSYLTVQDINATGVIPFNAYVDFGNIDAGNNTGWYFGGSPAGVTEVTYKLRSFTEPRRF
jgi:hypothetical protein